MTRCAQFDAINKLLENYGQMIDCLNTVKQNNSSSKSNSSFAQLVYHEFINTLRTMNHNYNHFKINLNKGKRKDRIAKYLAVRRKRSVIDVSYTVLFNCVI